MSEDERPFRRISLPPAPPAYVPVPTDAKEALLLERLRENAAEMAQRPE
ncbi:hypothetical protein [Phenylobacterium sp.]|jgi:hypothetical protein